MSTDRFPIHSLDSAPDASRPALEAARRRDGFVPNVVRAMAESSALIRAYDAVERQFLERSTFTPAEQHVVLMTVCYMHGSEDCMASLSRSAEATGLGASDIDAIGGGEQLGDAKLEALRTFTAAMVCKRGRIGQAELVALYSHGFAPRTVLDVIAGIAYKTISNYTSHVVDAAAR